MKKVAHSDENKLQIWLSKTSRLLIPQLSSHNPVKISKRILATANHSVTPSHIKTQLSFCNKNSSKGAIFCLKSAKSVLLAGSRMTD